MRLDEQSASVFRAEHIYTMIFGVNEKKLTLWSDLRGSPGFALSFYRKGAYICWTPDAFERFLTSNTHKKIRIGPEEECNEIEGK